MISRIILKILTAAVNLITILAMTVFGCYAVYSLWDNNQVLSAAEDVQADMILLKPERLEAEQNEEEESDSFADLLALNPDVVGWLTMDETNIDLPILQGDTNLAYINIDVYGNFSLAGSIYLDSRNSGDFSDIYSLLYGHHMAESNMFGDLDLYKDESFFRKNKTGVLMTPGKTYDLEVASCMLVSASDPMIFDPETNQDYNINQLFSYIESNSLFVHDDVMMQLKSTEHPQILALSTCSSEYTDARTIVLTWMK